MVNKGNRLYQFIFPCDPSDIFHDRNVAFYHNLHNSAMSVLPGNDQEEKCRSFIELTPGETQGWLQ